VNEVDGRAVAIGIVVGVVLGSLVFVLTGSDNTYWIYIGAGVGVILALGLKRRNNGGDGE